MMSQDFFDFLSPFVSENKKALFEQALKNRTRYITLVLEDIFQPHNASAVLRTCDCFGVQDVHVIENNNEYQVNPDVALGASKWLNLHRYNDEAQNTVSALKHLKGKGYRIVATTPHTNDVNLEEFDLAKGPVALVFGTELHGVSNQVLEHADEYLKIPMYGFTESFNISVSAAIILHYLTWKLRQSDLLWQLTPKEKREIELEWMKRTVKRSDIIEADFLRRQQENK